MEKYHRRLVESEIQRKLSSFGVLLLSGPLFCGKTTTGKLYQKSSVSLSTSQLVELAKLDPGALLSGAQPRLIDECQNAPAMLEKIVADQSDTTGKYLLTGSCRSSVQALYADSDTIAQVRMRPMTLWESQESTGRVSLESLFEGLSPLRETEQTSLTLQDIAFLICRGGWPQALVASGEAALKVVRAHHEGFWKQECVGNDRFRNKKPEVLRMILRSYARHISTEAPSSAIIEDVKRRNGRPMDPKTFGEYVDVLRDLYVIEEVRAWTPSIRSKTPIRTSPTRHLTDPSIACCALSIKPDDLINDLNLFGMLFEELAVRDLTVYASTMGGEVLHYRDNTGLECDAVVRLPDGRWGAVAVRLGGDTAVKEAASSLKTLQRKLMEKSNELPSAFLMVLTAVGAASLRPDGVCVVPITMLRP